MPDNDTVIEIIKSLVTWPVAFLIFGIFFILVFRKPISKLIPKLKKIKAGKFEADTSFQEAKEEQIEEKEEQVQEDKYEEEKKEAEAVKEVEQPKTLDEWRTEMILASMERDRKRADKAYQEMKKLDQDDLSRKKNEIFYLKLSHTLGNTDAISQLRKFLTDTEVSHGANMALGFCYANSDDFENSILFYFQALQEAKNDDEKSLAASHYSSSLYRDNKKTRAIKVLIGALSAVKENTYKVRLYEGLADIYEKENDYENRAFVLDKAIELKPNDPRLLFKAGYSYSESNYDELSLLHYKKARAINPKDESVQNNIGVQYDNLRMPIKSILSYAEAERLGNTLASANLAYRLINAGFTTEATEILNPAKSKENTHPNVNSALSEIPKKIEKEDKIEEEQNKSALKLRKFFLGFAEAKFVKGDILKSVSGDWRSEDGTIFEFEVTKNKIVGTWKKKLISYECDWKLEGELFNNSSVITIYEKEYNFSKSEYEYRKKGRGFLFCSTSGDMIRFIEIDDSYHAKKVHSLTKNVGG